MISIIIPIYNEEKIISELYKRLVESLKSYDGNYEVIFVNDGSTDNAFSILKTLCKNDINIKLIDLSRNFGHQLAITSGIDFATGDAIILMDGDLQDPPELIPKLIEKWKNGFDVVYTIKTSRKENFLKKFAFKSFYKLMQRFSSIAIPMEAGNFSLMDKKVFETLKTMKEKNRYIPGMRAWIGFKQIGIEFAREDRFAGKPQMTFSRLIKLAFDGIFSFSNIPLRFATYLGFVSAVISFLGIVYVLYSKVFTDKAISGWASTIVAILFIGGMILLTLGIIGEYIGRIYDEIKNRPMYLIKEKIGFEKKNSN